MTCRLTKHLLLLQLSILLVGTQMPGSWREKALAQLNIGCDI